MTLGSDNPFPSVLFAEGTAAPTTPATGFWRLYTKSDGLYIVDDAGASTGPFTSAAGAGVATDAIWTAAGQIVYATGTATGTVLAIGTPTQVLTVSAGTAVSWATPSGSGGEFVQTSTVHLTSGDLTTTSTTFTDATGLTVTLTTGARRCLVIFTGTLNNSTGGANTAIDLAIDGTRVGGTYGIVHNYSNSGAFNINGSFTYLTDVLTAASHTLKLQFRVDGGTGKIYASATDPARFTVIETSQTT